MKTLTVSPIAPKLDRELREMVRSGVDRDQIIGKMRSSGLNKIETIKLLRNHAGMSLAEAKDTVHNSPAWSDRFRADNALHETLHRAVDGIDGISRR